MQTKSIYIGILPFTSAKNDTPSSYHHFVMEFLLEKHWHKFLFGLLFYKLMPVKKIWRTIAGSRRNYMYLFTNMKWNRLRTCKLHETFLLHKIISNFIQTGLIFSLEWEHLLQFLLKKGNYTSTEDVFLLVWCNTREDVGLNNPWPLRWNYLGLTAAQSSDIFK